MNHNISAFVIGEPSTVGKRWTAWKRSFELYLACNADATAEKKKALLLHLGGLEVQEAFYDDPRNNEAPAEGSDVYQKTVEILDNQFKPVVCIPHERAVFRKMVQKEDESVARFASRLRHQGNVCDYGDALDMRITEQIFDGCVSNVLRGEILKKRLVQLADIIEEGRILETIDMNQREIVKEENSQSINKIKSSSNRCFRCGSLGHFANDKKCPARKKECDKCGLVGHFKKMCKTKNTVVKKKKKVQQVQDSEEEEKSSVGDARDCESDESDIYNIFALKSQPGKYMAEKIGNKYNTKVHCLVGGVPLECMVDSGASVNVIGEDTWKQLKQKGCKVSYINNETRKKLMAYGNNKLEVKGVFKADISVGSTTVHREIYVIKGNGANLLGRVTSMDLGVLRIQTEVQQIQQEKPGKIGKVRNLLVSININQTVYPVQQPCRRLPIPLQKVVDDEIQKLLDQDIIEPATGKITWASPLVVTPKDGGRRVRLCVDMRKANTAIIPQRHPLPTFEEMMPHLNGCRVFSKIDLNNAFHQLELHPDSRDITTFVTTKAYYRFKRLMFGMNCAAEIFQRELERVLKNLEGVVNFIDDILVFGRTLAEHNHRLAAVMKRLKQNGLTINEEKCQVGRSEVTFMGHELSARGILPTETKISAIKSFRRPESAEEVRSFLGLANYVGKFIPNLSTISAPLRDMIRKGIRFQWNKEMDKSFNAIKNMLCNPKHLGFYNPDSNTTLIVDASATGLGAVLLQTDAGKQQVISYASKSLSKIERKYSVLDKEAMAIYWGVNRFEMYLRGKEFNVITDHKPLLKIFSTDSIPNARQQRWVLNLQGYRFTLNYVPGKTNIADPLSRLSQTDSRSCDKSCEKDLWSIIESSLPSAVSMTKIIKASEEDTTFDKLRNAINTGTWTSDLKQYCPFQSELCCVNNLVLRLNRIVIPDGVRGRILDLAHSGHPGCNKMKRRLRAALWWPGIDKDVESKCKQCLQCQAVGKGPNPEPLQIRAMPTKPWSHLSADFLGPLPNNKFLFVLVDYYSRYCVVEIMATITSAAIIQRLERIFTRLGLPDILTTDNAANFCSQEFKDFCVDNCIRLTHTTPYWPAANGEVERQNRSILKALKIGQLNNESTEKSLQQYLYMYTVTPHSVTGVSPAELMFGRRFKDRFPHVERENMFDEEVKDRDLVAKYHSKLYRDKRVNAKTSDISIGDQVLMKMQHKPNKLAPNFHPVPALVVSKTGNSVTVQSASGDIFRRNSSHLKPVQAASGNSEYDNAGVATRDSETDVSTTVPTTSTEGGQRVVTNGSLEIPAERPKRQFRIPAKFQDYEVSFQ